MANKDKARVKLDATLAKYKVKLTKEQLRELQLVRAGALEYDPTGQVWLIAVSRLEKMFGDDK